MSRTFYDPSGAYLPAAGVTHSQGLADAGSETDSFLKPQALSRASLRGGYACSHTDVSDDDLVSAAQRGDQRAFAELCRRHAPVTKKKILRIVRNHEDAEDALQDTLLRAYMHLTSFRGTCKFSSWLTTIGVNSALMILRKRRVRKEICAGMRSPDTDTVEQYEPIDRSPGPEGICLKEQAIHIMKREVEKLHPSLRSIVNHYYGSECSLEEVAKAQDISLAAAKSRLLRGRVRLRSSLARHGIAKFSN